MPNLTTVPLANLRTRPDVSNALNVAFSGIGESAEKRVSVMLAKWKRAKKQPKPAVLRRELAESLGRVLCDEFLTRLVGDDEFARQRRAAVMALLSAVEFPGPSLSVTIPMNDELLTSEQAAELLFVSRTHINKLMDAGTLQGVIRTEGGHRRVPKASVLAYKAESKARQARGLDRMIESSQRLGLYEAELEGIPKPPKS